MNRTGSIIIVDDDSDMRAALSEYFGLKGHACKAFPNAEDALTHLSKESADVMLTDIVMPGMKGLELAERAKRLRPDMNIIVMTGYIDDFSYDEAIAAGASDFIKKPFTMYELMMRIKHVKLQDRLRLMSVTDELTGLPNRRGFFVLAEQQFKAANRAMREQVILFADLDDFKTINDTWGHQEGDAALVSISSIFRQSFRESDIIARMSGDEFAILLIDTGEQSMKEILDRLQKNLEHYNLRKHGTSQLSVSIGMAVHDPRARQTLDELLKQADLKMYEQKQQKKMARASSLTAPRPVQIASVVQKTFPDRP